LQRLQNSVMGFLFLFTIHQALNRLNKSKRLVVAQKATPWKPGCVLDPRIHGFWDIIKGTVAVMTDQKIAVVEEARLSELLNRDLIIVSERFFALLDRSHGRIKSVVNPLNNCVKGELLKTYSFKINIE